MKMLKWIENSQHMNNAFRFTSISLALPCGLALLALNDVSVSSAETDDHCVGMIKTSLLETCNLYISFLFKLSSF